MRSMDLNVDLGEGWPWDDALFPLATSASLCCGRHAGGEAVALHALQVARNLGVVAGAHPGYEDRDHFGRRPLVLSTEEVAAVVRRQLDDMLAWSARVGVAVRFVKPHGALYNQSQNEEPIARGLVEAVRPYGLPIVGLPTGILGEMVREAGLRFVAEGFLDRRYEASGQLVPRSRPDAILSDPWEIDRQLEQLIERGEVETLCIHGDSENAVSLATRAHAVLGRLGVKPRSFV